MLLLLLGEPISTSKTLRAETKHAKDSKKDLLHLFIQVTTSEDSYVHMTDAPISKLIKAHCHFTSEAPAAGLTGDEILPLGKILQ